MTDPYARSGQRWARDAELVFRPLADELVATCPHELAGRTVLDAGAGTGAVSAALAARGARVVAADASPGMLAWQRAARPPAVAADVRALPLASGVVDDAVAAFVLNHLTNPAAGLAELARVTRPGGTLLATVFGNDSHSEARDRVDELAAAAGWRAPGWYLELKRHAIPLLGSHSLMATAAQAAGITDFYTEERPVEVGITEPGPLVRFRLGHPVFARWLDSIGEARAAAFAADTERAIAEIMTPYRPVVVFLRARTGVGPARSAN